MRLAAAVAATLLVVALTACGRQTSGQPSANGCATGGGLSAGTSTETLYVDGKQRTYQLTTPSSSAAQVPVVFDFPGLGESAREQEAYSHLAEQAAARGWLGVTPQESGALWTLPPLPGPDDISFFRAMVADLETRFCADRARIYAAGISNGAAFTGVLGCKATTLLAGIAMVEGINAYATCADAGPLAVLGFNGTADTIVPYEGGGVVPPAPKAFEQWMNRNHCTGKETTTDMAPDVQMSSGSACAAATELYTLRGGGHTWAGAAPVAGKLLGPTNQSISATKAILDFFAG